MTFYRSFWALKLVVLVLSKTISTKIPSKQNLLRYLWFKHKHWRTFTSAYRVYISITLPLASSLHSESKTHIIVEPTATSFHSESKKNELYYVTYNVYMESG